MQGTNRDLPSIFHMRPEGGVHPLTLPEQIAEAMFHAIINGQYQPGERIREEEVSRHYQVSRGPVREALRILEKDSVVVILPHRGAHVTELTAKEVGAIFSIRKALIGLAIRGFGPLPEDALDEIDRQVREMQQIALHPESHAEYARASARLHLFIANLSDNTRLVEMIRSLARQTYRYTMIALSDTAARQRSAETWGEMATLLRKGRMAHAADLAEELIERSRQAASDHLERNGAG